MRKTSHDGGDSTSITSGIENEIKKSSTGMAKIKRNSFKKKVQSFSHESDDGVIEPLLQKDKTEFPSQSAKFSMLKTKTEVVNDKMDEKEKLLPDSKVEKLPSASLSSLSENLINGTKEGYKSYSCTASTIHNHMNTNVFSHPETIKKSIEPKSQILVEIDGNKQGGYNSTGPLIFTTAKIHTDGKTMQMEPVQVTPVPILSTVEGSVVKTSSIVDNQKVNLGLLEKSSNIIKAGAEIKNIDVNPKMPSTTISSSKLEPTFSKTMGLIEFPKVTSEDKKGVNNALDSKLPNLFTSPVIISDSNMITTTASKTMLPNIAMQAEGKTLGKPSLATNEVPKVQEKSIIVKEEEIDVNKNVSLPSCSTLPTINAIIEKGKDKKDLSYTKQLQRQTKAVDMYNTNLIKDNIVIETKRTATEKPINATDNHAKHEINNIPGINQTSTYHNPSLKITQDKTLKSVPGSVSDAKTHTSTEKFNTSVSSTMPIKTIISVVPANVTHTTTTTKESNIKTTAIIDEAVGKITTSTSILSSASVTPTVAVTSISSVSNISVDPKATMSTKVKTINETKLVSLNNTGATKTAPKTIHAASNVKVQTGAISAGKYSAKPTPAESVITSGGMLSGMISLSTTKSTITTASSISSGPVPKCISTAAPTKASSNNVVKSSSVIPNKLNTSKAHVTPTSSKIKSPISCLGTTGSSTTKPSTSMVSKTQQNISSSQTPVTTTKLSESTAKTINSIKKPAVSASSSKVTQASNVGKNNNSPVVLTKSSNKSTPTVTPIAIVTTTASQSTSTTNESIDLQNNEHKKEKLK